MIVKRMSLVLVLILLGLGIVGCGHLEGTPAQQTEVTEQTDAIIEPSELEETSATNPPEQETQSVSEPTESVSTNSPTTNTPATEPPATQPPVTEPLVTAPPATDPSNSNPGIILPDDEF